MTLITLIFVSVLVIRIRCITSKVLSLLTSEAVTKSVMWAFKLSVQIVESFELLVYAYSPNHPSIPDSLYSNTYDNPGICVCVR